MADIMADIMGGTMGSITGIMGKNKIPYLWAGSHDRMLNFKWDLVIKLDMHMSLKISLI